MALTHAYSGAIYSRLVLLPGYYLVSLALARAISNKPTNKETESWMRGKRTATSESDVTAFKRSKKIDVCRNGGHRVVLNRERIILKANMKSV